MKNKNNLLVFFVLTVIAGILASAVIILFFDLKLLTLVAVCEVIVLVVLMRAQENAHNENSAGGNKSDKKTNSRTKGVEAEKIAVACQKFEDVRDALEKALPKYKLKTMERISSNVFIFHKRRYFMEDTMCFMAVDLRDEVRYPDQLFLHEVFPYMMNLNVQRPSHPIRVVLIICVNNRDRWLDALINNNIEHDYKLFKLPVVISFSEGEMYMARQKGGSGYGKMHYNKMRKVWLKIADDAGLLL